MKKRISESSGNLFKLHMSVTQDQENNFCNNVPVSVEWMEKEKLEKACVNDHMSQSW